MILFRILGIELWREIRLARSYSVDFVANQVLYTLGFLLLSGIFQLVAEEELSSTIQLNLLVGYITWRVADGILLRISRLTADDSQWGTMEQLWLTPLSFHLFLLGRVLAIFLYETARALLIAVVVSFVLRLELTLSPMSVLIFLLTESAIFGVGFILIGLQLVHKNVSAFTMALSTMLLFLTGALAPLNESSTLSLLSQFLPLTAGITLLREIVVEDSIPSAVVTHQAFLWLVTTTTAYFLLGLAVVNRMQRTARQQGSLAHY